MSKLFVAMVALAVVAGCDVPPVENFAPSDGYATARHSNERGSGCSLEKLRDEQDSLRRRGYSEAYVEKFSSSYKRECEEHQRKAARRAEDCATGKALLPCKPRVTPDSARAFKR